MKPALSIAAAQPIPARGDVDANVAQHARIAHAAAAEQAQLVVFPELSLTGYELDLADELAFEESDPRLVPVLEIAAAARMTLVVGAPVRLGARLHIGAFVVAPDRTVELYTKHHLGGDEPVVFQPGDRNPLVRLAGATAAVAVCADANRPAHAAGAAARGADVYLVSAFITPDGMQDKAAKLTAYAAQHSMTVAFANYGGPSGGLDSGGGSAIWSAAGEVLAQVGRAGPGLVVATRSAAGWRAGAVMLT